MEASRRHPILEITAKQFHLRVGGGIGSRCVQSRRNPESNCGQRRTHVSRFFRLPWLQTEVEPVPRSSLFAGLSLNSPQICKRLFRGVAGRGPALIPIVECKDGCIQNCLRPPRLFLLGLVEIVEEPKFGGFESFPTFYPPYRLVTNLLVKFRSRFLEYRSGERIREKCVATHTGAPGGAFAAVR